MTTVNTVHSNLILSILVIVVDNPLNMSESVVKIIHSTILSPNLLSKIPAAPIIFAFFFPQSEICAYLLQHHKETVKKKKKKTTAMLLFVFSIIFSC